MADGEIAAGIFANPQSVPRTRPDAVIRNADVLEICIRECALSFLTARRHNTKPVSVPHASTLKRYVGWNNHVAG